MDEDEILRRALEGDAWAYERLGERLDRELRSFFQPRFRGELGFELAQRTALRLLSNLHSAPRNSMAFSGWIVAYADIQTRRWFTSLTRERRRAHLRALNTNIFELGRHFDEAQFSAEQHCELMLHFIEQLPAKFADVMLARLGGSTCEEIARDLGVSKSTVSRREQAARRRLLKRWLRERATRTTFQTTRAALSSSSSEK